MTGAIRQAGVFQPSFAAWKAKMGVLVHNPKRSQDAQALLRQRHQPILVALGIANMHPHVDGVNIANRQPDAFAQAQSHVVGGKEKDFVAQPVGCGNSLSSCSIDRISGILDVFGGLIRGMSSQVLFSTLV